MSLARYIAMAAFDLLLLALVALLRVACASDNSSNIVPAPVVVPPSEYW